MILLRIAMAAIDHESRSQTLLLERLLGLLDALGVVVGSLLTTAQDNEAVFVTGSADDSDITGFGDGKEVMGVSNGTDSIDSDIEGTIRTILEADGERETGGQLAMELGLSGAGTDGTDR